MHTAAQLRLIARNHLKRAGVAAAPARCGMLLTMAREFDLDARAADREERREAFRQRSASARTPAHQAA